MLITSIWREYFDHYHEGIGTTYERFLLHNYFKKIRDKHHIKSVIEAPCFGMTGVSGINSMWWALNGSQVTVVDDNPERLKLIEKVWSEVEMQANFICNSNDFKTLPFEDNSIDLGWNFAALWFVPNLKIFMRELTRVVRNAILVCIPNRSNIFHLMRVNSQKKIMNMYPENAKPSKIKDIMRGLNWIVDSQGFFDIPPWPDIAMKKEDLLNKVGLNTLSNKMSKKDSSDLCILDYFSGINKRMERDILRYSFMENLPPFISKYWAHHQYFIFLPK